MMGIDWIAVLQRRDGRLPAGCAGFKVRGLPDAVLILCAAAWAGLALVFFTTGRMLGV